MNSNDVADGVRIVLEQSHELASVLGRLPTATEIRWRASAHLRLRFKISRRDAVALADQLMDVVAAASEV